MFESFTRNIVRKNERSLCSFFRGLVSVSMIIRIIVKWLSCLWA